MGFSFRLQIDDSKRGIDNMMREISDEKPDVRKSRSLIGGFRSVLQRIQDISAGITISQNEIIRLPFACGRIFLLGERFVEQAKKLARPCRVE